MKKMFFIMIALFLLPMSFALKTGVVVEVENNYYLGCVNLDNANAYDVLKEFDNTQSNLKMKFDGVITNTPFLREINDIKGKSVGNNAFSGWNFWVKDGNDFNEPPELAPGWGMGIGDYEVKQRDVIGVNFGVTEFNPDFSVKKLADMPDFYSYEELCEKLFIEDVEIRVDGDEDKGKIDVKPGSQIRIEVNVENKYGEEELKNVYVRAEFDDIDLDDETDEEDIKEGRDDKFVLRFTIPEDAQDDDTLEITVFGEVGRQEFEEIIEYDVEVDKEKHDLIFSDISGKEIDCNNRLELSIEITNQGEEDEDVLLNINSEKLNINEVNEFEINENDDIKKRFVFGLENIKEGDYNLEIVGEFANKNIKEDITVFKRDCNGATNDNIITGNVGKKITVKQGEVYVASKPKQEVPYFMMILFGVGLLISLVIIVLLVK